VKSKIILILFLTLVVFLTSSCGNKDTAATSTDNKAAENMTTNINSQKNLKIDEKYILDLISSNKASEGIAYDSINRVMGKDTITKIWSKGSKAKHVSINNNVEQVTIIEDDYFTSYIPSEKKGQRYITKSNDGPDDNTDDEISNDPTEDLKKQDFKYIETVEFDGQKCHVVTFNQNEENVDTKVWISEKYAMAVKIESKGEDGTSMVLENKNIRLEKLSDDLFKVPSDIVIQEINF
jgi:outer membrane lipoprotein-sorting protein